MKNTAYEAKNYEHLLGTPGFSDKLLRNHFKLYEGYVKNANELTAFFESTPLKEASANVPFAEMKRRFGWEFNGMKLHEYYFGNRTVLSKLTRPEKALGAKIANDFGSFENWKSQFTKMGAMRGIGWVLLVRDVSTDRLLNIWINEHDLGFLVGTEPLLVMDVFEHAFLTDYGLERADYIAAFMKAVDWNQVQRRLNPDIQCSKTPTLRRKNEKISSRISRSSTGRSHVNGNSGLQPRNYL